MVRYCLGEASVVLFVVVRIFANGWRNQARSAFALVVISSVGYGIVHRFPFAFVFRSSLPAMLSRPGFDKKVTSDVTAKIRVLLRRAATESEGRYKSCFEVEMRREARHTARRGEENEVKGIDLKRSRQIEGGVRQKVRQKK